jgi:diguanylate cyclase (GGDEF)-like protein/PAS domain S-box-containing protein
MDLSGAYRKAAVHRVMPTGSRKVFILQRFPSASTRHRVNQFSWVSEQSAGALVEHLPDGVYAVENERVVYANPALCTLLGRPAHEIVGRPFVELVAAADRAQAHALHRDAPAGRPASCALRLLAADGASLTCEVHAGISVDRDGRAIAVGSVRDLTDKMSMQAELLSTSEELARIYAQLPDMYYRIDMDNVFTMVSPACLNLLGYTQEEMVGQPLVRFQRNVEEIARNVRDIVAAAGRPAQTEGELVHKNGSAVWIMANSTLRYGPDGKPAWRDGVARDITSRKRMEEQLALLARTDSLTGVYSRRHFMEMSEDLIRLMRRTRRPASLLMADLDNFKKINDAHGHHAGDLALTAFADTCRSVIRESDLLGRLGGEEFALMLPETSLAQAEALAERLREATAAIVIPLQGKHICLTVSIGLVELDAHAPALEAMMRRADLALYRAKAEGRNRVACC